MINLIHDTWIPVRRKNGTVTNIAPWQVTECSENQELIELASVRPDFNGALIQFLIALLQTTCAPEDSRQWRTWFKNSPKPDELKARFEQIAYAFNLDGNGFRFMQDIGLPIDEIGVSIGSLLIETPGENTKKENKDHSPHIRKL